MCRNELENPRWWVLVCYCAEVLSIPITLVDRERGKSTPLLTCFGFVNFFCRYPEILKAPSRSRVTPLLSNTLGVSENTFRGSALGGYVLHHFTYKNYSIDRFSKAHSDASQARQEVR
jgi:hypothetical protein